MFSMIAEMSELFEASGGKPPNEIWAHPATMAYILADPILVNRMATELRVNGTLKVMPDNRILPGVIYLDRDSEHTRNQRAEHRSTHVMWEELKQGL
jgi:hypothetical protein